MGWIAFRSREGWKPIILYVNYMNIIYIYTPRRRRVGLRGTATWPWVPRRIYVGPPQNIKRFL